MIVKKIDYVDYDGNPRSESFYFNLTRSEVTELQLIYPGGYAQHIEKIVDSNDRPSLMKMFKDIIKRSYGEKSEDGKRLIKSDELSVAFMQTPAYDQLFMELCTDADAAIAFVSGILPDFGDPEAKDRIIKEASIKAEKFVETGEIPE